MNLHTHPPLQIRRWRSTAAFTLTEMLVTSAIGTMLLAGILSAYLFSAKGLRAISNYADIHADGRHAIDRFARDMRAVSQIISFSPSAMTVTVPVAFDNAGMVTSNKTVIYQLSDGKLLRYDSAAGGSKVLAQNIQSLTFHLYDRQGSNTTVISNAKGVQVDINLRKRVISQVQSEDYLSARLDMRNKT